MKMEPKRVDLLSCQFVALMQEQEQPRHLLVAEVLVLQEQTLNLYMIPSYIKIILTNKNHTQK